VQGAVVDLHRTPVPAAPGLLGAGDRVPGKVHIEADRIRAVQPPDETPARLDPSQAATALLALVEGLGVHVLGEHYTPETALTVFDAYLSTLFSPSG
jgi:BetI-type transcriptional repressor, C-terminal